MRTTTDRPAAAMSTPGATSAAASHLAVLVSLALHSACAPSQAAADPASPAAPDAAPASRPAPAPEPAPQSAPTVDLATVSSVRFTIVAIPDRDRWVACGKNHSVGTLKVEVLDAGEPPPRMLLLVSCPTGVRNVNLTIGATLTATLHDREQPWPAVEGLPADLPRRQVAAFAQSPTDAAK